MNFVNSVNFPGASAFVLYFLQNISYPRYEVNEVNRVNKRDFALNGVKSAGKGGLLSVFAPCLMNINVLLCTYMRLSLSFVMLDFGGRELRVNFDEMKFTPTAKNAAAQALVKASSCLPRWGKAPHSGKSAQSASSLSSPRPWRKTSRAGGERDLDGGLMDKESLRVLVISFVVVAGVLAVNFFFFYMK